jgi:hypothetical protein
LSVTAWKKMARISDVIIVPRSRVLPNCVIVFNPGLVSKSSRSARIRAIATRSCHRRAHKFFYNVCWANPTAIKWQGLQTVTEWSPLASKGSKEY